MHRKNIIAVTLTIFISLTLFFIALNILKLDILRPVKIVYSSVVLANKENFLPCKDLPTTQHVKETILANADELEKLGIQVLDRETYDELADEAKSPDDMKRIALIEENESFAGLDRWKCDGKSDILFQVGGGTEQLIYELGKDILGIPYKVFNY